MLVVENLSKKFGYLSVFEEINFSLKKGVFAVLCGDNGQGKTTLLKILARLHLPTKGSIFWNQKNIDDCIISYQRSLFFLSSEDSLYNSFSALENLQFFLSFYQNVSLDKILCSLAELNLSQFSKIPIQNFSTGMKKKLLLVLMKLQQPELLLLDEPYAGLDDKGVQYLNQLLIYFKNKGASIFLVTHHLDYCANLVDLVWKLASKKIYKH